MANLSLFDPMTAQMNKFFQNLGLKPSLLGDEQRLDMKLDLSEDDKNYIVRAEIPGAKKEDIKVDIDGNRVSISAEIKTFKEEKKNETVIHSERYEGKVFRSFTLDSSVNEETAQAAYKDGVLELTLPKINSAKSKRLTIG